MGGRGQGIVFCEPDPGSLADVFISCFSTWEVGGCLLGERQALGPPVWGSDVVLAAHTWDLGLLVLPLSYLQNGDRSYLSYSQVVRP